MFKTRANQLIKAVTAQKEGATFAVNVEKPRKGCFEVRGPSGKVYVSLTDMPRPFKPLRELDIEELAERVAADVA